MSYTNRIPILSNLKIIILFLSCLFYQSPSFASGYKQQDSLLKSQAQQMMNQLKPLSFQENKGQMADIKANPVPYVLYKAEAPDLNIWITTSGITYQFFKVKENEERERKTGREIETGEEENIKCEWHRVDMLLKDADIRKENIITENDVTQGKVNFYLGHCPYGIFNVKSYTRITIKDVYPGIDWVLYTSTTEKGSHLTHDFIVHPGADPNKIKLIYEGSGELIINENIIKIKTELGEIAEGKLLCYQDNENNEISSQYTINKTGKRIKKGFSYEVGIQTGDYNTKKILIIDPKLVWGTYYGGNQPDGFCSVVIDANDNLFITGYTNSNNFPELNPGGTTYYEGTYGGSCDAFILKFDANGVRIWATYYGGNALNNATSIAMDNNNNNVYITGYTTSTDFPVLALGGAYNQGSNAGAGDVFILKFDANGVRLWATYYGGSGWDEGGSLTIDNNSNLYVTGHTPSADFPVLDIGGGAYYQNTNAGYIDAFILKFNSSGVRLWSTYYGGNDEDKALSITTDAGNNLYLTGFTRSTNLPVLDPAGGAYYQSTNAGMADIFIIKLNSSGIRLWATCYGGTDSDYGQAIVTDNNSNIYVTGYTMSTNLPVSDPGGGAYYQNTNAGSIDIHILKFNNNYVRQWATYYGGSGNDYFWNFRDHEILTDGNNIYITGCTSSTDFPVLDPGGNNYYQGTNAGNKDAFIIEFNTNDELLWGTYNGTSSDDFGSGFSINAGGCIFAFGEWFNTGSNGLSDPGNGAYYIDTWAGSDDSYIMKFCSCCSLEVTLQPQDQLVCSGDSITLFIQAISDSAVNYQWFLNGNIITGAVDSFYTVNPVTPADTGEYTCIISNTCGTDTSDMAELNIDIPTANAGSNVSICSGDNTTLTATGGTTYEWNTTETTQAITVNPTITSTYTVTVTNATGCTDTDDVIVSVNPALVANAGTDQTICAGFTATLTATGGMLYTWSTSGTTQTITVNPTTSSTYTVTISNATGSCTATDDVFVIVNPAPAIDAGTDETVCDGENKTLTATGGVTYEWNTTETTQSITVNPTAATTYTVTGTGNNGCSDTDEVTLTVNTEPSDISLGTDTCIRQGGQMILDAGPGIYTYSWQDGNSGQTYTVSIAGDYWVNVSNGCGTVSDTIAITECLLSQIFIPNTFTPNGDNNNDVFAPIGINIQDFEMYIYDRWGQMLYATTDINKGWDGSYESRKCPVGVYSWLIFYNDTDGTKHTKYGHVTLLR